MKNVFYILILIVGLMMNCKNKNKMYLNGTSRVTNGCDCSPPKEGIINNPCGNNTVKCVKHFFNNGTFTRYYTIQWENGCAAFLSSTIKICYNSNCKFQIQFSNLPLCLKDCCLEESKCYESDNFACGNSSININFEGTNCQGFAIGFSISGDPSITINCVDANGNSFSIKGNMI